MQKSSVSYFSKPSLEKKLTEDLESLSEGTNVEAFLMLNSVNSLNLEIV